MSQKHIVYTVAISAAVALATHVVLQKSPGLRKAVGLI